MTDEQIIKALECCSKEPMINCRNCPYEESCNLGRSDMQKDALGLIDCQKSEIERLNHIRAELSKEIDIWKDIAKRETGYVELARAEAIKEFVERLRTKRGSHGEIWGEDIDNLVKEMTEETST